MQKGWKERFENLKLNIKFTIVIIVLVVVPITLLVIALFENMQDKVIDENISYMRYTMQRYRDNTIGNIDSINMTTQFFLSDSILEKVLEDSVNEYQLTTEELYQMYHNEIASLERLVNNNLLLYGVRVYAVNDNVQEMMPILYRNSRMKRLEWAQKENFTGWNFNYQDELFDGRRNAFKIASLITPIENYENGCIGIIETAVSMEKLFPSLYEEIEEEWGCFVTSDGIVYSADEENSDYEEIARQELEQNLENEEIYTYHKKQGGKQLIVSYTYIKEMDGTLFSVQDVTENMQGVYQICYMYLGAMVILVCVLGYVVNLIVNHLLKQFYAMLESVRSIRQGNLSVRIINCGTDEMGELGTQINKMLDYIEQLMKERIDREILVKNSEIRALQNQINAHFIYNVLESIKMMAEINEEYDISDAVTSLGKLLRYSMRWKADGLVRVEEEIEYIKDYIALINLRFDYEIYLSLNMPELIMQQPIPKMSLQPIIENAIYHGIEELAEDTSIYMKGYIRGEDCVIEITDAGKGMTEEEIAKLRKKITGEIETTGGSGNGIGLKNVQDRIRINFGESYGIGVDSKIGCYTKITVCIPLQIMIPSDGGKA